jgi:limonene-1,2-epoxide hydrolase
VMTQVELTENPTDLPPLDAERVLDLWSKTYNTSGKPDWSHIFGYYVDEIVFQDPIQEVIGKGAFVAMCNRLTERCKELRMNITAIASSNTLIFMQWEMTMIFRNTPSTTLYGCSKLTLDDDGRITHQRDYYDLWGDIFVNVPGMKRAYPRFMKRVFG